MKVIKEFSFDGQRHLISNGRSILTGFKNELELYTGTRQTKIELDGKKLLFHHCTNSGKFIYSSFDEKNPGTYISNSDFTDYVFVKEGLYSYGFGEYIIVRSQDSLNSFRYDTRDNTISRLQNCHLDHYREVVSGQFIGLSYNDIGVMTLYDLEQDLILWQYDFEEIERANNPKAAESKYPPSMRTIGCINDVVFFSAVDSHWLYAIDKSSGKLVYRTDQEPDVVVGDVPTLDYSSFLLLFQLENKFVSIKGRRGVEKVVELKDSKWTLTYRELEEVFAPIGFDGHTSGTRPTVFADNLVILAVSNFSFSKYNLALYDTKQRKIVEYLQMTVVKPKLQKDGRYSYQHPSVLQIECLDNLIYVMARTPEGYKLFIVEVDVKYSKNYTA